MKTKPFPATTLLAVTAAVLLCGQITAASAAETKSSEQESSAPLEQVMGRINQLEDGFAKKREATCAIIETEVAAKHITDATAFELRHALRLTGTASIDFRAIFTGPKTATDNEKILKSLKELETDCDLTSDHIKAAVPELGNGLRQRVRETVLGKPKPDEIQNLLKTLEQMRSTMLKKGFLNSDQQIPWEEAFSILKALKRLVEAENAPFSDELPQAAAFFRNSTPKGIMGEGAIRARLDRTLDPVAKTFETKRAALDAALEARKPFTEISLAVAAYAEVVKRLDRMQSERFTNIAESLNFYQSLATAFEAIAGDDDPKALEYLRFAKGQLHQAGIGSDKPEKYPPLVAAIEQELRDKLAKLIARNISDTSVRLAAAKSPDDLKSLSKDIMAWEQQQMPPPGAERPYRRGQIGGGLGEMARPLETLASAWAQGDPAILYRHDAGGGDQYRGPCAKELTELRNRIEHDLFATILKAPELNAPPLAGKEINAALNGCFDLLAQSGEWRRLHDVLKLRSRYPSPHTTRIPDQDTIAALQSFLTAQNFELAEQWAEAVVAYKTVLRSTAQWLPTKPAAERIKAIAKEHPDAIPKDIPDAIPKDASGAGTSPLPNPKSVPTTPK